mgnify:CR=1 FL=1
MTAPRRDGAAPPGRDLMAFDCCVAVQAALVELFKRQGHRQAFLAARDELETVRAERETARRLLRGGAGD